MLLCTEATIGALLALKRALATRECLAQRGLCGMPSLSTLITITRCIEIYRLCTRALRTTAQLFGFFAVNSRVLSGHSCRFGFSITYRVELPTRSRERRVLRRLAQTLHYCINELSSEGSSKCIFWSCFSLSTPTLCTAVLPVAIVRSRLHCTRYWATKGPTRAGKGVKN